MEKLIKLSECEVKLLLKYAKEYDDNKLAYISCGGLEMFNKGAIGYIVSISENKISIVNDIIGAGRLYYWKENNVVTITDDINIVTAYSKDKEIDQNNRIYFERQRCTLGDQTYFKDIMKLPPSCELNVDSRGNIEVIYKWPFGNISQEPNEKVFKEKVKQRIDESIQYLKTTKKKIIVSFSGGFDSFYMTKRMVANNINFTLVYWNNPELMRESRLNWAKKKAAEINHELTVIDLVDYPSSLLELHDKETLFDTHPSKGTHFIGQYKIKELFGEDVIIVNGEQGDYIFSFGPSEESFKSYTKRYLYYGSSTLKKKLFVLMHSYYLKEKLSLYRNQEEKEHSFLDSVRYGAEIRRNDAPDYYKFIDDKVKFIKSKIEFSNERNLQMYLLYFGIAQGADSHIVVSSTQTAGFELLWPYSQAALIGDILKYKDDQRELHLPKYAIK